MATATSRAMTDEEIRDFDERYVAAWNSREASRVTDMVTEDISWDDPALRGETAHGRAAVAEFLATTWRAMPDLEFEHRDAPYRSLAEPNKVIASWRMRGTFTGPLDPPGFAPTGGKILLDGLDEWEFRDGLIARYRSIYDLADVAQQIGAMPEPNTRMERAGVMMQRLQARMTRRRSG
jgi:steroid delta-isomerase-like uncharacterized protein